jgi:hypothetical protein
VRFFTTVRAPQKEFVYHRRSNVSDTFLVSISQLCAEAQATIARARSLFGESAPSVPTTGSADLSAAAQGTTAARSHTTDLSGTAVSAYQAGADRSAGHLSSASASDTTVAGQLTTAAAIDRAGAAQLDQIKANNDATVRMAPLARTPAAQRVLATALRSHVTAASQVVQSTRQQVSGLAGQIQLVDYPRDKPKEPPTPTEPQGDQDGDPKKKKSGSYDKSFGKGGDITPTGPTTRTWGTDTDPHGIGHREGTFDGGHGKWSIDGPGRSGGAQGSEHADGTTGKANVDGWLGKAHVEDDHTVFGNNLHSEGDAGLDARAGANGSITDHGVSEGAEAFAGGEIHGKADYHLGPVDLGLGVTGQAGAGASEHFSAGVQDGKYVLGGDLGLAWGLGGKIAPHIAIDKKTVDDTVGKVTHWLGSLF